MTGAGLVVAPARAGRSVRARARAELALGAVGTAVVALLLARQFRGPGAEMDEGAVLAYSGRVLHGAVPWRDFQTFYGPGNLWLVAGASKVFGLSVATERAIGFGYRIAIVLALFSLARRFGTIPGVLSLAVCVFLIPGQGVMALALWGSLAFSLAGLAALTSAVALEAGGRRDRLSLAAGALFGCGLLIRFDLALAVVLPSAVLLPMLSRRERRWTVVGFAVAAAAYAPQAILVGFGGLERLERQLRATEPGRRLPFPTLRGYPGMLLTPSIVVTVLLVVVGAVLVWANRRDLESRILLAAGLFSAALLPTTLSRADGPHVVPGSIVSLALLPALVTTLVRRLESRQDAGSLPFAAQVTALTLCAISVLAVFGAGPDALRSVVAPQSLDAYRVTLGSRWFPVGTKSEATDTQAIVSAVDRLAKPGQSLFVGPADLRRTNYNDTYVYYLLPQLQPASFYMEMNPQTANRPGSGLAQDVEHADWLILTRRYDRSVEPNSSSNEGSSLPNRVVSRDFCRVAASGADILLQRCS
jgi:hypothetical protein